MRSATIATKKRVYKKYIDKSGQKRLLCGKIPLCFFEWFYSYTDDTVFQPVDFCYVFSGADAGSDDGNILSF